MDYETLYTQVYDILVNLDWERTIGASLGAAGSLVGIWIVGKTLELMKRGTAKVLFGFGRGIKSTLLGVARLFRSSPSGLCGVLLEALERGGSYLNGTNLLVKGAEFTYVENKDGTYHKLTDIKVGKDSVIRRLSDKEQSRISRRVHEVRNTILRETWKAEETQLVATLKHLQA